MVGRQQSQTRNRQAFAAPPGSTNMACAYRGSSGTREIRHVLPEEAGNIEYTGISKYQSSQCSVERCEESERKTQKNSTGNRYQRTIAKVKEPEKHSRKS